MKGIVIIPSYNTGAEILIKTVRTVMENWPHVCVAFDGSDDGSDKALEAALGPESDVKIIVNHINRGKGATVLDAARECLEQGFTHVCSFDSDGQHCAADIAKMFEAASDDGSDFVLGIPQFGPEAPAERIKGRKVGNGFASFETLGIGPADSLYGMRVYPIVPLLKAMKGPRRGRRYDFDTEAAVRLTWAGLRAINIPTPVRYPRKEDGGVTHFKYLRDNVLLTFMHTRLLIELPFHLPTLIRERRKLRALQTK
ncbi:MAG: glycosyltransferase family 2 protein [Opitutales bacterium]|nr:glycosyltransferase family 2 protein [Opitutales bacterium]